MMWPPAFVAGWPSWIVESGAGLLLAALWWWVPLPVLRWGLELATSVLYERYGDSHGWSWRDVLQRLPALAAVELARGSWG